MKVKYKGSKWIEVYLFLFLLIFDLGAVIISIVNNGSRLNSGFFIRSGIVLVILCTFVYRSLKTVLSSYITYDDKYLIMNNIGLYYKAGKNKLDSNQIKLLIKDIKEIRIKDYIVIKSNKDDIELFTSNFDKNKLMILFNDIKKMNSKLIIK